MGYLVCSMPGCRKLAHGSHDAYGNNLCNSCKLAYMLGITHQVAHNNGSKFPYKVGGETWEKA